MTRFRAKRKSSLSADVCAVPRKSAHPNYFVGRGSRRSVSAVEAGRLEPAAIASGGETTATVRGVRVSSLRRSLLIICVAGRHVHLARLGSGAARLSRRRRGGSGCRAGGSPARRRPGSRELPGQTGEASGWPGSGRPKKVISGPRDQCWSTSMPRCSPACKGRGHLERRLRPAPDQMSHQSLPDAGRSRAATALLFGIR